MVLTRNTSMGKDDRKQQRSLSCSPAATAAAAPVTVLQLQHPREGCKITRIVCPQHAAGPMSARGRDSSAARSCGDALPPSPLSLDSASTATPPWREQKLAAPRSTDTSEAGDMPVAHGTGETQADEPQYASDASASPRDSDGHEAHAMQQASSPDEFPKASDDKEELEALRAELEALKARYDADVAELREEVAAQRSAAIAARVQAARNEEDMEHLQRMLGLERLRFESLVDNIDEADATAARRERALRAKLAESVRQCGHERALRREMFALLARPV